eukprot:g870.t1
MCDGMSNMVARLMDSNNRVEERPTDTNVGAMFRFLATGALQGAKVYLGVKKICAGGLAIVTASPTGPVLFSIVLVVGASVLLLKKGVNGLWVCCKRFHLWSIGGDVPKDAIQWEYGRTYRLRRTWVLGFDSWSLVHPDGRWEYIKNFDAISIAMVEEVSARFDDGREGVLRFNNEHEHAVLVKSAPTAELSNPRVRGCVFDMHFKTGMKFNAWDLNIRMELTFVPLAPGARRDEDLPLALSCPITMDLFREPVIDREGYTFERDAIVRYLTSGRALSPMTRRPVQLQDLVPNRAVRDAAEAYRDDESARNE